MIWESSQELYVFSYSYRCKYTLQHNGMTNSEREMCKWMLVVLKSARKMLPFKIGKAHYEHKSSGSTFCLNYRVLREDYAKASKNLLSDC